MCDTGNGDDTTADRNEFDDLFQPSRHIAYLYLDPITRSRTADNIRAKQNNKMTAKEEVAYAFRCYSSPRRTVDEIESNKINAVFMGTLKEKMLLHSGRPSPYQIRRFHSATGQLKSIIYVRILKVFPLFSSLRTISTPRNPFLTSENRRKENEQIELFYK